MTCSAGTLTDLIASLYDSGGAAVLTAYGNDYPSPTASGTPAVVFAGWFGQRGDTGIAASLMDTAVSAPWTRLGGNVSTNTHQVSAVAYIADDTPPSMTISWHNSPEPPFAQQVYPRCLAVSLNTSATTPVQTVAAVNHAALTIAAATAGSVILVFLVNQDTTPATPSGFSLIASGATASSAGHTTVGAWFAKCAAGGETALVAAGTTYDTLTATEWLVSAVLPVADFTADDNAGPAPLPVQFTDLSTGSPISWLWDFGDGSTSTSQNPSHTYTASGTYAVTLTATNGAGSDSETKLAFISVSDNTAVPPPPPGGAVVEIYVTEAGAYRWDDATWDDAIWAESGWQDVTPLSINAQILWGSSRPELGILSQPDPESWALEMYDPDRVLDPANVDGPYYGDLRPGLPIRINHSNSLFGGTTIRTGIVESMGHTFLEPHLSDFGYIRATNGQATYANAAVPHDTALADTLWARAQDAMEAAGLPVKLLTAPDTDPPLVAWADPGDDQSVWDWISDAAQSVLWVPYFDNHGWLGFREYANPLQRGIQLAAPELIGLSSIIEYNGNYSRVIVHDSADVEVIHHVSAEYGTRTFTRDNLTPNAADWADAVIADRAFHSLRWVAGEVYPASAANLHRFARTQAVELVNISDLYTDPVVGVDVIVVGGSISLTARRSLSADWRFVYNTTQGLDLPLIEDGSSPAEYLTMDGGSDTEYLFPD